MAWYGYCEYDGTEIINVERTEKYVENMPWFKRSYDTDVLEQIFVTTYDTPMTDNAPWTDPDFQDSYDFWGVYPLSVEGIENSTRESTVVQNIRDGGSAGRLRHATRSVVFSTVLMGATECAVEYGFNWLKSALLGAPCRSNGTTRCAGSALAYFRCEPYLDETYPDIPPDPDPVFAVLSGGYNRTAVPPDIAEVDGGTPSTVFTDTFDGGTPSTVFPIELSAPYPAPFEAPPADPNTDPTGCLTSMQRQLYDVQINSGPEITKKKVLTDGSAVWTVQFTAVAGDPYEYGRDNVVVEGFLGGETSDPFGPGVDGPSDQVGEPYTDPSCPPISWEGVYDPLCPALVAPPAPVDVTVGCFEPSTEWWRRYFTIPKEFVPLWGHSVPVIKVSAQFDDLRQVRVRFWENNNDTGIDFIDECSPAGDLLISYVPQDNTLVIDGVRRSVYIIDPDGLQRRADSLVFTSDGKPIVWPELTCGYGYITTIDTLTQPVFPAVDLSVVPKVT